MGHIFKAANPPIFEKIYFYIFRFYLSNMVNSKRLRNIFFKLVRIDSPTGEENEAIREVLDYLRKLHLRPTKDKAGNIFVSVPGRGSPLLLEAHLDTVEPGRGIIPYQRGEYLYSEGGNILGADDKASVAIILELLNLICENNSKCRPLEIVFSTGEEGGSVGISKFNFRKIKAREAVGMDRAKRVGIITSASPHIKSFELTIIGKSSHAGAEPEKGINAIVLAARVISRLVVGRIDQETTFNIGLISGGQGTNIVPEQVIFKGDIRSFSRVKLEQLIKKMKKVAQDECVKEKARYKLKIIREVAGYKHRHSDSLIKQICKAMRKMRVTPELTISTGASDLNIINEYQIKAVEIANGVRDAHTKKERVRIKDLIKMVEILVEIIK